MEKSVTLAQIAREAGVSVSTVSRILNGTAKVGREKKEAVERVLGRLSYHPNVLARGLASGRTMSIGVLTQDISSPFYGDTLRGIEHGLSTSGYHPIFTSGHWQASEELEAVDLLLSGKTDALIVLGGVLPDEKLHEVAAKVPLVTLGRLVPGLERQCLRLDNFKGARVATQHLIDLGHRTIAHIAGDPSHRDAQDRLAGYRSALLDAHLEFDESLVHEGDFMETSGFLAATRLAEGRRSFSAIFVANDQMAYGARLALNRKGLRTPEDVSIVGFDDLPSSSYTTPPLTTVAQPTYDMGLAAAKSILRLLDGEEAVMPTLDVQLVVRESTTRRRS